MEIDTQGSNTSKMSAHRMKQKHDVAGRTQEVDLQASDIFDLHGCACHNLEEKHDFKTVLLANPDDNFVTSDVDQELLFKISFAAPVRLTQIIIRGKKGPPEGASAPRTVKLYANQQSFDFSDADTVKAAQTIVLTKEQVEEGAKIRLAQVHFQNVQKLDVFIQDNQDDEEVTFLNRLSLLGRATNMYHTQYE